MRCVFLSFPPFICRSLPPLSTFHLLPCLPPRHGIHVPDYLSGILRLLIAASAVSLLTSTLSPYSNDNLTNTQSSHSVTASPTRSPKHCTCHLFSPHTLTRSRRSSLRSRKSPRQANPILSRTSGWVLSSFPCRPYLPHHDPLRHSFLCRSRLAYSDPLSNVGNPLPPCRHVTSINPRIFFRGTGTHKLLVV